MLHLGNGDQLLLQLPSRVHAQYDAFCDIVLAPVSASPAADDDDDDAGAAQTAAGDHVEQEQEPAAGALRAPRPLAEINPIESATPLVQKEFFEETLLKMVEGDLPPYKDWTRLDVMPPDPICGTCEDSDAYALKPIRFWSHEKWRIATPCATHGWAHAEHVSLRRWHMRRVKDISDDFYLAGRETLCCKCQEEKESLKKRAEMFKAELGSSQDAELSLQLKILQALTWPCSEAWP